MLSLLGMYINLSPIVLSLRSLEILVNNINAITDILTNLNCLCSGMLFWHKHDLERAMQDLANFTPFPDEWSVEDKVLFEQAFQVLLWFLYVLFAHIESCDCNRKYT